METADLIAEQRDNNTEWWKNAVQLWWSIASEITPKGFFIVAQPGRDGWVYGVFRIEGDVVTEQTPLIYSRQVAFRRLRKLDRQTS